MSEIPEERKDDDRPSWPAGGLKDNRVRAALYWALKRRKARIAAQQAQGNNADIFDDSFSSDFE